MAVLGSPRYFWRVSDSHADLTGPAREIIKPLTFPSRTKQVTINLKSTAVVIIDMQNDFCAPGGWLDQIGVDITPARGPITPLNRLLSVLRDLEIPVIWVNWGNRKDKLNLSPGILHVYNPTGTGFGLGDPLPGIASHVLEKGSWGAEIIQDLDVHPNDVFVDKYRMSGFWDTPLDSILRNLRIDTLLFAGVNMDQCVMSTLQDASALGYNCILLEDCSATTSPRFCLEATIYNVSQCFGFVASSTSLLDAIRFAN